MSKCCCEVGLTTRHNIFCRKKGIALSLATYRPALLADGGFEHDDTGFQHWNFSSEANEDGSWTVTRTNNDLLHERNTPRSINAVSQKTFVSHFSKNGSLPSCA